MRKVVSGQHFGIGNVLSKLELYKIQNRKLTRAQAIVMIDRQLQLVLNGSSKEN